MSTTVEAVPQAAPAEKLDFKRILPIFVIVLIDLLGLTIIIPLMSLYAASFSATPLVIGLLGASYPIFQFIGAPILGRLSDRYGRRPVLLISQLGTFTGFIILGLANSLWMLFLARIIDGISGANISTAQAAISDSTNEKTRTQGLGLLGAAFGLGFVIGPIIAFLSLQASSNNYHVPAFVAAGFSLVSILLTWLWLPETHPVERRGQNSNRASFSFAALFRALAHPAVGTLLILMFFQQIAFGGFQQIFALFTLSRLGLNASGNAVIFIFVGLIVIVVQGGLIGPWSRKYGDRKLIFAGLVLLSAGLIMTSLTPSQPLPGYTRAGLQAELSQGGDFRTHENPTTRNVPIELPSDGNTGWMGLGWILLAMIPATIGGSLLQPSINSLITKRVEPDEIGGTLGISAALLSAANAIAPVVWGLIFQTFQPTTPYLLGGLGLIALLFFAARSIQPGAEMGKADSLARAPGSH